MKPSGLPVEVQVTHTDFPSDLFEGNQNKPLQKLEKSECTQSFSGFNATSLLSSVSEKQNCPVGNNCLITD